LYNEHKIDLIKASRIMGDIKITFGIIVLNGQPFIGYNLRSLYPFAHQIIVVEGACRSAAKVANPEGHSRDNTLEMLRTFKAEEDPDNKLIIVTAETMGYPNGFWFEKDEMSQAYAIKATGNYLWQIDSDEFYKPEDMEKIINILKDDSDIKEIAFRTLTFWGGLKYRVDGVLLRLGDEDFHRLFAWKPGYKYLTHRPPTVVDDLGNNIKQFKCISAKELATHGIYLYHYEYLFPLQVRNKAEYYSNASHCRGLRPDQRWVDECYMNISKPYRVHNINGWLSWLEKYEGTHPIIIETMMKDITENKFPDITKRHTTDIDSLIKSKLYKAVIYIIKITMPLVKAYCFIKMELRDIFIKIGIWPFIQLIRNTYKGKRH